MMNKKILKNIEKRIYKGEINFISARKAFFENTFFITIDEENSLLYDRLFPPSIEFLDQLNGSLKDLKSDDPLIKLEASRYIRKEAYKENKLERYKWLTYPKTIKILLSSLDVTDDKRITEEIILALGMIVERYEFPDLRIYEGVSPYFTVKSKSIKNAVATTLSKFHIPSKWDYILEIAKNSPNKFGQELVIRAIRSDSNSIPLSMKPKLRELLVNMRSNLSNKSLSQKDFIAVAIDLLDGKKDSIAELFG